MGIIFDQETRTFTLDTKRSTYQIRIGRFGHLLHMYYGQKTAGDLSYLLVMADRGFSGNPYEAGKDRTYSMDALPQEFPVYGNGDYRSPALIVRGADGSVGADLRYESHEIVKGKYSLERLPAVYADEREAQTLIIRMKDAVSGLVAELYYGVIPHMDIITRAVKLINTGNTELVLEKAQSAVLDFVTGDFDVLTFYGRHAMERNLQRQPLGHGEFNIGSRRGMSSHQYNPLMILAESHATETQGSCYAMEFVYSGGFRAEVGKDQYGNVRIQMGLMDEQFDYPVMPGESFIAPEVIMTYSKDGLGRLSRNLHDCVRYHIVRGGWRDMVRPLLLNSWEASYFDFTGDSLVDLAREAKDLGLDMLVMDDGWFMNRNDDNTSLGDWIVDEKKLGCSLKELTDRVNDLGLKFGIWVEPEMISEESELYKKHPDWALKLPGRDPIRSRNQLVLDFSRKEVVDGIFDQIAAVLDDAHVEYIKWDYNRSIADVFSADTTSQGKVLYDYILGLYDFLERLNTRYPHMLIEGCSGGGGRFDAGMLYYTPQIWCSDNSDAIDRLRIQYGTSFGYPSCTWGAHVSVCPNEQNGRMTPMETRGFVAMAGTFGYELNPAKLSEEEKAEIRTQVESFRELAPLVLHGEYYRLSDPFRDEAGAWQVSARDKSEVLMTAVLLEVHGNMTPTYVRLQDLTEGAVYVDVNSGKEYPAGALMQVGLPLPIKMGQYHAYQYHLKRKEE